MSGDRWSASECLGRAQEHGVLQQYGLSATGRLQAADAGCPPYGSTPASGPRFCWYPGRWVVPVVVYNQAQAAAAGRAGTGRCGQRAGVRVPVLAHAADGRRGGSRGRAQGRSRNGELSVAKQLDFFCAHTLNKQPHLTTTLNIYLGWLHAHVRQHIQAGGCALAGPVAQGTQRKHLSCAQTCVALRERDFGAYELQSHDNYHTARSRPPSPHLQKKSC